MRRPVILPLLLVSLALCHPGGHGVRSAEAHPGGTALGQRLEISLAPAAEPGALHLQVEYVAELPAVRLQAEARPMGLAPGTPTPEDALDRYSRRQLGELASGVSATWEGANVALTDVELGEGEAVRAGDGGFVELHVRRAATLPGDAGTLRVVNRNHPDEGGYFATYASFDGRLVVTETSLAVVKDGHVRKNTHGAWTREESAREPTFTVRPAGFWEERDGTFPLPERLAGLDSLAPPTRALAAGVGGLLVVVGGLLGLRERRRRVQEGAGT